MSQMRWLLAGWHSYSTHDTSDRSSWEFGMNWKERNIKFINKKERNQSQRTTSHWAMPPTFQSGSAAIMFGIARAAGSRTALDLRGFPDASKWRKCSAHAPPKRANQEAKLKFAQAWTSVVDRHQMASNGSLIHEAVQRKQTCPGQENQ